MPYPWELQSERPWERLPPPGDLGVREQLSDVVLAVTSLQEQVRASFSRQCVGRLDSDVSTQTVACCQRSWALRFGTMRSCSSWNSLPEGELGKWPQNLPLRTWTERAKERGWPWLQHVISRRILMLVLRASLLYVITKIILCQCVCNVKHRKQCWRSHTTHHSNYNAKLHSNCTLPPPPPPPNLPSNTRMENFHGGVLQPHRPAGE